MSSEVPSAQVIEPLFTNASNSPEPAWLMSIVVLPPAIFHLEGVPDVFSEPIVLPLPLKKASAEASVWLGLRTTSRFPASALISAASELERPP